jgi:hypothetical protein
MKKGEGIKFVNPAKKGEQILLEKGWPGAKDPLHAVKIPKSIVKSLLVSPSRNGPSLILLLANSTLSFFDSIVLIIFAFNSPTAF